MCYALSCSADDDRAPHGKVAHSRSPLLSSHPVLREEGRMTAPVIMLLSNDDTHLSAMHALLTDEGYRMLRCRPRDVTDAHAVVKRAQADLVILDLWLAKREDGWAFLRRMCADLETMHIPAIIASGQPEMLPQQDALLRTMQCHVLRTPFDGQELLHAVTTMFAPSPVQSPRDDPMRVAAHVALSLAGMSDA